jgi:hypothetical protein
MPLLLGWASRGASLVLANEEAWAMVDRARRFDVSAGGRFELRGGRSILVWEVDEPPAPRRRQPVALIEISWRTPDPDHATIARVAWNARGGVPDMEPWRALEVLLGRPVEPPARGQ